MKSVIAIIPARGGSKGIHKKNIRKFAGKPLIIHTIHAAKRSKNIQRTIVTTDDTEIADITGKEDVIMVLRPPEFATDISPTIDAVLHSIQEIKKQSIYPDVVILLRPTSPSGPQKILTMLYPCSRMVTVIRLSA